MNPDVLVVGAGPTGLMLANQLLRHGVQMMLIDRHAGPARETRALGVQARTMEIYAQLGIMEEALALGHATTAANLWSGGRPGARVPLGDIGRDVSPWPFVLILGQDDNERLLGACLGRAGQAVHWNTELVGLEQDADAVTARIRQPNGSERTVRARWVAGCDGARSTVRTLLDIPFVGAPYEHVFFVADTVATGSMVPGELNVYLWRSGFHLFFPMRGSNHWRLVGILPPALRGRDDLAFEDVVPSLRSEAGAGLVFQDCSWFSTYRIHHRRAASFSAGRCFLLGDAAHIHSPVGAQGMNTGLQDAYNLAWKLAWVASGQADEKLLATYASERIPVATRLLNTTDRAFRVIVSDSSAAGVFRSAVAARLIARLMALEPVRRLAFLTVSQTGIRYRRSPLSCQAPGAPPTGPRAGDRFPWLRLRFEPGGRVESLYDRLDDRCFNLVLLGEHDLRIDLHGVRVLVPVDDAVNAAELERVGIPRPSYYLIRPDGHIGLAGGSSSADALRAYFAQALGTPG